MKLYLTNFKDFVEEVRARNIKKVFYFLDNNTEPIKVIEEANGVKQEKVQGIHYTAFIRFTAQEPLPTETNLVSCMVTVFNKSIQNNTEAENADKEILHQKDMKVTEFKGILPKVELVEGVWVI